MEEGKASKSRSTSDTEKLYEAWTEFSKKINERMLRLANAGTHDYGKIAALWNEYVQKMGEKLSKMTPDDKTTVKEMQSVWTDYSGKIGKGFVDLMSDGNGPYRELYALYSEYSEKMGRQISEIMSERIKENKDLYELWMDTFGMNHSGYLEDLSGSIGNMGKLWSETWEKSRHLFPGPEGRPVDSATLKEMGDLWTNAYSKALQDLMKSDAFANFSGSVLERNMELRRVNNVLTSQYLGMMGMPTRENLDDICKKLHELDRKVSDISRTLKTSKPSGGRTAKR